MFTKSCEVCQTPLTSHHKYWECQSAHSTCHTCIGDCIDNGLVRCPKERCGKDLNLVKPQEPACESVYIFVDDSNMWIEAKKLASRKLKLKTREDPRIRFDIGKVTDVVAKGREVVRCTLYGSEPPAIDSVWKKIQKCGWKVLTSRKHVITKKEKQVDQQLVADVTELASDVSIQKGTIIIVSGDADVIPAIKAGLRKKWKFEIWMWRSGMSNSLKAMQRENPEFVKVVELDEYHKDITFTNFKFNMAKFVPHLKSQTAVITNVQFEPTEKWEKELSEQLGWPFQFCWIGDKAQDPAQYRDIILVFASVKAEGDGKNAKDHFDEIFQKLKQVHGAQATTYPVYHQKYHRKSELTISNRYDKLYSLDDKLSVTAGDSSDEGENSSTYVEGAQGIATPLDPIKGGLGLSGKGAFAPFKGLSSCSGYGSLVSDSTSCPSAPISRATSRSSLSSPCFDTSGNGDSNGHHSQVAFTTVVPRRLRKVSQQFSELCRFRSRCQNGLKCKYHHDDGEKEFFRNVKKNRLCHYGRHCLKGSRCEFAHSTKEGFCCKCNIWGHIKNDSC